MILLSSDFFKITQNTFKQSFWRMLRKLPLNHEIQLLNDFFMSLFVIMPLCYFMYLSVIIYSIHLFFIQGWLISNLNVKTNRIGSTKWTYHKERSFAIDYLIFLKN